MTNDKTTQRPLTTEELKRLSLTFTRMTRAAKHEYLAMVLLKYEDKFPDLVYFLGDLYENSITRA